MKSSIVCRTELTLNLFACCFFAFSCFLQPTLNNGSAMGSLDSATNSSPLMSANDASAAAAQAAMNAMRVSMADSMMRSSMNTNNSDAIQLNQTQNHLHQHAQHSPEAALRNHAEAILRSQAEAALRLAVSQAAAVAASTTANANNNLNGNRDIGCLNL